MRRCASRIRHQSRDLREQHHPRRVGHLADQDLAHAHLVELFERTNVPCDPLDDARRGRQASQLSRCGRSWAGELLGETPKAEVWKVEGRLGGRANPGRGPDLERLLTLVTPARNQCLGIACLACPQAPRPSDRPATAGIDSLNARLVRAYRSHDALAYAALYTDTAVFEWPAFSTVRGPAELTAMAKSNWASLSDMDLRLTVANRRIAADHATEFGAFEQSYRDSGGAPKTEYGRYVSLLVRQRDGMWRMDRFFGFEDSTRAAKRPSTE